MTPAELLREAANRIDTAVDHAIHQGHHYAGIAQLGDQWAALLTPDVAGPLAEWLRAEAMNVSFVDQTGAITIDLPCAGAVSAPTSNCAPTPIPARHVAPGGPR